MIPARKDIAGVLDDEEMIITKDDMIPAATIIAFLRVYHQSPTNSGTSTAPKVPAIIA
jgi:hypothetical protein